VEVVRPTWLRAHAVVTCSLCYTSCQMPNRFSPTETVAIPQFLSVPRFSTYLVACGGNVVEALRLYHWNAQASAAFLFPLHVFEICTRNAASNAIESAYNVRWPWSPAFERSLPNPARPNFSPRFEIQNVRNKHISTGKVIADIRFAFWVSMYTTRHTARLWTPYFRREYPNVPAATTVESALTRIHQVADSIRGLRNRLAHHEPIFKRDLVSDYTSIMEVIGHRCVHTAGWLNRSQMVSSLLTLKP
jgi:hypothetical protein